MRTKTIPALLVLLAACVVGSTQESGRSDKLAEGIDLYEQGLYARALEEFADITENPPPDASLGDAYFWLAKSELNVGKLDEAERNLDFFLLNYPSHKHTVEANYLRGRLLYLQNDYQGCIQAYQAFIDTYADSAFVPNAYFWVGESLYRLGRFDEAEKLFDFILREFPRSVKVEESRYRKSLIILKKRAEELLKLLRLSHEEALKSLEEFQRKEQTYEQAIAAYQRRISALEAPETGAAAPADRTAAEAAPGPDADALQEQLKRSEEEIAALKNQIDSLNEQIATLQESREAADRTVSAEPAAEAAGAEPAAEPAAALERRRELLQAKEEALELKAYLLELSETGG